MPGTLEERAALRPIGRNNERYQQMLEELRTIAVMADEVGFDAFSTTEHHLHSEGFEASVAPLLLYADLAARTKRIKFAPLGLVLPSWDPIRCAEEIAILDHLTKGRVIAGFARGYQDRWTNVLGQQYRVSAATMDGSEVDLMNREVFEEVFDIIKLAWTEDAIEYNGKYYQIPVPYKEGISHWPPTEWTNTYGAPGELDDEGVIRRVCVIPKPYQGPTSAVVAALRGERDDDTPHGPAEHCAVDFDFAAGEFQPAMLGVPGRGGQVGKDVGSWGERGGPFAPYILVTATKRPSSLGTRARA